MTLTRRDHLRTLTAAGAAAAASEVQARQRTGLRVLAAGQPAAILIQALRPSALLGWPRRLRPQQLTQLRPELARLPELGELTAAGATANLEAVIAIRPDLILDYGDLGARYQEAAAIVRRRTGLDYQLLDGRLAAIPQAVTQAGSLLGAVNVARPIAALAADILADWRRAGTRPGPRFYYGRGPDGLEAALPGSLAAEVLEGAGWRNVAAGSASRGLARVALEQVLTWDPELVVTLDPAFAAAARADRRWSRRRSTRPRGVVLLPDLPFGWLDRPPSINRLLGCAWAASGVALGGDPRRLAETVRLFHRLVYGRTLSAAAAATMAASGRPR